MKTSRLILFFTVLAALTSLAAAASSAGLGRVRAILIVASKDKGAVDPKLADYDATLRGILRFESFRWVAEGSAAVPDSGTAAIALPRDFKIELSTDGKTTRAVWLEGSRRIVALALPESRPTVLGGPPWNDKGEVCAIILVPEGLSKSGK